MADEYSIEQSVSRDDAAAILRAMGDGVASGSVRLGADGEETVVEVPDWVDAEVEYETDEEAELEVELSWHPSSGGEPDPAATDESTGTESTDGTDEADAPSVGDSGDADDEAATPAADDAADAEAAVGENPARLVGPAGESGVDEDGTDADDADGGDDRPASKARFELFEDRAGEWRWRLVHRNGNIIADSGEGYSRKSDARTGLRSVMRNAPGAQVVDASD